MGISTPRCQRTHPHVGGSRVNTPLKPLSKWEQRLRTATTDTTNYASHASTTQSDPSAGAVPRWKSTTDLTRFGAVGAHASSRSGGDDGDDEKRAPHNGHDTMLLVTDAEWAILVQAIRSALIAWLKSEFERASPQSTDIQREEMAIAIAYLNNPDNRSEIDTQLRQAELFTILSELPDQKRSLFKQDRQSSEPRPLFDPQNYGRPILHALTGPRLGQFAMDLTDMTPHMPETFRNATRLIVNAPTSQGSSFTDVDFTDNHDYDGAPPPSEATPSRVHHALEISRIIAARYVQATRGDVD